MRRPHFEISIPNPGGPAFVHTRVELFYRRFLDEVDTDYKNDEALFDGHLKAIIWGVLYIEGLVNYKLYRFTAEHLRGSPLSERYWDLTKHARIQDKISFIFATDHISRPRLKDLNKKFLKMVDERNRLVHLKEVPTLLDLEALVEKLGVNAPSAKWSEHTPYPKIVFDTLATPLAQRLKVFRGLGDALEHI